MLGVPGFLRQRHRVGKRLQEPLSPADAAQRVPVCGRVPAAAVCAGQRSVVVFMLMLMLTLKRYNCVFTCPLVTLIELLTL